MKIGDLMTKEVLCIGPYESLNQAAHLLWEGDCGCLPVVDENRRVIGVITDRDICMSAYTQGRPLGDIQVGWAMSRDVHSCQPDEDVETAEARMKERQVRRLPIVDEYNCLVGLLSLNDLAMRYARDAAAKKKGIDAKEVADTLAAVCRKSKGESEAEPAGVAAGRAESPRREPAAAPPKPKKPRSPIRPQA